MTGSDVRGLVYAVLELADRVEHGDDPLEAIRLDAPIVERPANPVRSVARLFASELDDKPWFHDEGFWRRYLSMVVAQRFNRVNLMVGLGLQLPVAHHRSVPVLRLPVPRRRPGVGRPRPAAPRRGARSQPGDAPVHLGRGRRSGARLPVRDVDARVRVVRERGRPVHDRGARPRAPRRVLRRRDPACSWTPAPSIGGLTIRTHGESGVPERSWDFWKVVFDGIVRSGRRGGPRPAREGARPGDPRPRARDGPAA